MVAGIDAIALSMATVGILLGLSLWAWGYVRRRDQHAAVILKERASYLVQKRDQELVRLDAKLQAEGMIEAAEQIRELRVGFDGFKKVLEKKLSSGELGYHRFRVVLEVLFLSALDNLELRRARTRYEALTESARELFQQNQAVLATLQHSRARVTSLQAHRAKARTELDAVLAEVSSLTRGVNLAGT